MRKYIGQVLYWDAGCGPAAEKGRTQLFNYEENLKGALSFFTLYFTLKIQFCERLHS